MSYRAKTATVYLLGFFLDLINLFVANVAYPVIGKDLHADVHQLAWVGTGYILGLTLIIPLSSWLSKRLGAKTILLLSLSLFAIATTGAGTASSVNALIAWRVLQGVGGGLLIPVGQTLTYQQYQPNERAGLTSVILLVALLAPALSPAAGGIIVDYFGWRWIFYLNLPLALLTLILAVCWLKTDEKPAIPPPAFDFYGFVSGSAGLILILFGLGRLGKNTTLVSGIALTVTGIITMIVFIRLCLKNIRPILNLRLVFDPLMRISMLVYLLIPGVFIGVSMITMLYLQSVLSMSASDTGFLMLPWSLASFLAITLTGKLYNRCGPRPLFIAGCIMQGAGIVLLTQADATTYPLLLTAFAFMGLGGSLSSSTAQSTAFIQTSDDNLADASAIWNINRQLAFGFGVAFLSLFLSMILSWQGVDDVSDPAQHTSAVRAFHLCFMFVAASALIPLFLCLRLPNSQILQTLKSRS